MDYHKLWLGVNFKNEFLCKDIIDTVLKFYKQLWNEDIMFDNYDNEYINEYIINLKNGKINSKISRQMRLSFAENIYIVSGQYEISKNFHDKHVIKGMEWLHDRNLRYNWIVKKFPLIFSNYYVHFDKEDNPIEYRITHKILK